MEIAHTTVDAALKEDEAMILALVARLFESVRLGRIEVTSASLEDVRASWIFYSLDTRSTTFRAAECSACAAITALSFWMAVRALRDQE